MDEGYVSASEEDQWLEQEQCMGEEERLEQERWLEEKQKPYFEEMIAVFWDIDNCPVPEKCNPRTIAQNIKSALVNQKYRGPMVICAYGDGTRIPPDVQEALESTDVIIVDVPDGLKDIRLILDMLTWAIDYPPPSNYLVISGDRAFARVVNNLADRRFNILEAQPHKACAVLLVAAKTAWRWTDMLSGGPPLTNDEFDQILKDDAVYQSESDVSHPDSDMVNQPSEEEPKDEILDYGDDGPSSVYVDSQNK